MSYKSTLLRNLSWSIHLSLPVPWEQSLAAEHRIGHYRALCKISGLLPLESLDKNCFSERVGPRSAGLETNATCSSSFSFREDCAYLFAVC